MKTGRVLCGLLIAMMVFSSCEPALKVRSRYDKTVDFSRYRTFTVSGNESLIRALSQVNYERVLTSIRNEMRKKGFTEIRETPDLMVNVSAIVNSKASVSSNRYYEYGSVYRPYTWGPGVSYSAYDARYYKDGSLIIDVVDAEVRKLLWQGIGTKEIDSPSKHPEKDIPKAVESIMVGFPPTIVGQ